MGSGKLAQVLLGWAAVCLAAVNVACGQTGNGPYQANRFTSTTDQREVQRVRRRGQETLRGRPGIDLEERERGRGRITNQSTSGSDPYNPSYIDIPQRFKPQLSPDILRILSGEEERRVVCFTQEEIEKFIRANTPISNLLI
ncbi:fibrillin-2-like protein [Lates japonicus]|uniref:Fibrillin-2-like protein n=1 Tax=Lates japonicus TaxID=270547 RepID=A0AAD3NJJ1_LATJO|nr:fibrillin-2-like protein [Lates japonicus]